MDLWEVTRGILTQDQQGGHEEVRLFRGSLASGLMVTVFLKMLVTLAPGEGVNCLSCAMNKTRHKQFRAGGA